MRDMKQLARDLNKVQEQILSEVTNHSFKSMTNVYQDGRVRMFNGELVKGIRRTIDTPTHKQIHSTSPQAYSFEEGYEGFVPTRILRKWADYRGISPLKGKMMKVSFKDNTFHQAEGFISKSIPSESQVNKIAEEIINKM